MASIASSRITAIHKLRAEIFQTAWNPTGVRTGAKYLRARLRGPSMLKYYPPVMNLTHIGRQNPELGLEDLEELQRLDDVDERRARGKGAPKKAKSKEESRRLNRRR